MKFNVDKQKFMHTCKNNTDFLHALISCNCGAGIYIWIEKYYALLSRQEIKC